MRARTYSRRVLPMRQNDSCALHAWFHGYVGKPLSVLVKNGNSDLASACAAKACMLCGVCAHALKCKRY